MGAGSVNHHTPWLTGTRLRLGKRAEGGGWRAGQTGTFVWRLCCALGVRVAYCSPDTVTSPLSPHRVIPLSASHCQKVISTELGEGGTF